MIAAKLEVADKSAVIKGQRKSKNNQEWRENEKINSKIIFFIRLLPYHLKYWHWKERWSWYKVISLDWQPFTFAKNNNANLHNFPTLSLDNPVFEPCSRHWAVAAKHRTPKTRDMPFVGILPSNWDLAWLHFTDARFGVASFIYRLLCDFSDSIRGAGERDLAPAAHSIWVQWRVRN